MKFRWFDANDSFNSMRLFRKAREKYEEWEWIRWDESDHESPEAALDEFIRQTGTKSMFSKKMVYSFGMPSCQAAVAKEIPRISKDVMFLLIAPVDKRSALYKKAKSMKGDAKVDDPLSLQNRTESAEFVKKRGQELGLEVTLRSAQMMADFVGSDPGRLSMELAKLKYLSKDGGVHPWMVEQATFGKGEADVREMCSAMIKGKNEYGHEIMARLLNRGEPGVKICGYLMDWCRKMLLADSCLGEYNKLKGNLSSIRKYKAPVDKVGALIKKLAETDPGKEKAVSKIKKDIEEAREARRETAVPMFPKEGTLYYSCKEYQEARGYRFDWYRITRELFLLQIALRKGASDESRLMHGWLSNLETEKEDEERS